MGYFTQHWGPYLKLVLRKVEVTPGQGQGPHTGFLSVSSDLPAEPPHREFNLMPKPRALLPNPQNPKKTQSSTTAVMELPEHEADC